MTILHYTNFLWCKEHDQAGAIEGLEQLHAEKLAGAAFEAIVQQHMQALSHISNCNPSEHTKVGWLYRTDRTDRTDRADRTDRTDRTDRPDRTFLWVMDDGTPQFFFLFSSFFATIFSFD